MNAPLVFFNSTICTDVYYSGEGMGRPTDDKIGQRWDKKRFHIKSVLIWLTFYELCTWYMFWTKWEFVPSSGMNKQQCQIKPHYSVTVLNMKMCTDQMTPCICITMMIRWSSNQSLPKLGCFSKGKKYLSLVIKTFPMCIPV